MILWSFGTLRHEHPVLFDALGRRSLELVSLPPDNGGFNEKALSMIVWVGAQSVPSLQQCHTVLLHVRCRAVCECGSIRSAGAAPLAETFSSRCALVPRVRSYRAVKEQCQR
jgi:hypothetical protein